MCWQHGTVPGRGHGVPARTGDHSVSPLQHWACGAGPGRPGHPTFPSCIHCGIFWGERGSSRSRAGRVCLACSPGDGGQPLLSEGVCTYSCQQQGEIKVYLYSGGFGHCRRSAEGCQGLAGGESGVPGTQLRVPWDWAALVSSGGQNRGKILVNLRSRWDFLPKSAASPSCGHASGSPIPGAGGHSLAALALLTGPQGQGCFLRGLPR